jgi:hypothetical protein
MTEQLTWPDVAVVVAILIFAGWIAWLWWGQR